jgi:hypothetical protein
MEFQVAEAVEQLETQHAALKRRIAALVEDSQKGKNDGAEIPKLTREAAALSSRIDAARAQNFGGSRTKHAPSFPRCGMNA